MPSYSDSAIVALRKKRGGLKNSFCQVKNEKGLVSMHDLSSFTTTILVVVKKIVKRKRVMFVLIIKVAWHTIPSYWRPTSRRSISFLF